MRKNSIARIGLVAIGALAIGFSLPTFAQKKEAEKKQEPETRKVQSLTPSVAKDLVAAYEQLEGEQYRQALTQLNALIERHNEKMTPFDRASVLQIRGFVLVNLDNDQGAMRDFEAALKIGELPPEQNAQLRLNVAQLHFRSENYPAAIRSLELWLKEAEKPDASGYYLLAAAHYYLKNYEAARPHIVNALKHSAEPVKRHYDLTNIIYAELSRDRPRLKLLGRMIGLWASDKNYWKQLAGLLSQENKQRDAFAILEAAYRVGLVREETDVLTLAQFYSVYENPYRGARLLEAEMETKTVKRTVENLELLSQLWSQSREHGKAAAVLREAAKLSDTGMLSYRLGQVLLAEEQSKEAEAAFQAALKKGGLKEKERADAWLLLGSARFNQAGPGDRVRRGEAAKAFAEAQKFSATRERASQWREYIKAIDDTETRQVRLEEQQKAALAEAARDRLQTTCRARQLTGADIGEDCLKLFREKNQPAPATEEEAEGEAES